MTQTISRLPFTTSEAVLFLKLSANNNSHDGDVRVSNLFTETSVVKTFLINNLSMTDGEITRLMNKHVNMVKVSNLVAPLLPP